MINIMVIKETKVDWTHTLACITSQVIHAQVILLVFFTAFSKRFYLVMTFAGQ
jgi:hypothetical protein